MKTLVIYASKYGCTADCANYLKTALAADVTLIDVEKNGLTVDLEQFDTIIIGGSVYIGRVSKKLQTFCQQNLELLCKKRIGIFLCCYLIKEQKEVLAANFPAELLSNAKTIKLFGSEARIEKMSFLDKTIIKAVTKGDFSDFKISKENMDAFIKEIKG